MKEKKKTKQVHLPVDLHAWLKTQSAQIGQQLGAYTAELVREKQQKRGKK